MWCVQKVHLKWLIKTNACDLFVSDARRLTQTYDESGERTGGITNLKSTEYSDVGSRVIRTGGSSERGGELSVLVRETVS